MPRISDIYLLEQAEQPILSIRARSAVTGLPRLIGESYGRIAACLGKQGAQMSDVPLVIYHNMDMQDLDVEMAFPVARPLPGGDGVGASALPAGRSVCCMYLGPYTALEPVYAEMAAWLQAQGLTPLPLSYEYYYNGPDCPEEMLLTKIVMPVK